MTNRPPLAPAFIVLALVAALVLLCGCGVHQSSGKPAPAPEEWLQLCRDQPTFPGCKA